MPNSKKHATVGGVLGLSLFAINNFIKQYNQKQSDPNYKFDWTELALTSFAGGAIGAVAGLLPDILEPATSPNHRKIFHSTLTVIGLGMGLAHVQSTTKFGKEEKQVITTAGICYLSHLVLDSNTPAGLPLLM